MIFEPSDGVLPPQPHHFFDLIGFTLFHPAVTSLVVSDTRAPALEPLHRKFPLLSVPMATCLTPFKCYFCIEAYPGLPI